MSAPPILVTPHEGSYFILNGRHRACCAYARSHNLEAFVAFDMHDLRFHTPQKAFGGYFEGVDEAFNNRWTYIDLCARSGIYNIAQLVNANCNLF